eukprot:TRINITY_DN13673_c0_g1_i1.p1 TRINITY_DN13673_c0_g1~~TRINITY_DN13673_c0_g1_i1.p1  ORF type:complete len:416 (+),score=76.23 TRINITY_DN13673_c0_g1_i1:105-1250(+)
MKNGSKTADIDDWHFNFEKMFRIDSRDGSKVAIKCELVKERRAPPLAYLYEYEDAEGNWAPFDRTVCVLIEGYKQRKGQFVVVNFGDFANDRLRVDLDTFEVYHIDKKVESKIRRLENQGVKQKKKKKSKVVYSSEDYYSSEESHEGGKKRPTLKRTRSSLLTDEDFVRIRGEIQELTKWSPIDEPEEPNCPVCIEPFTEEKKAYKLPKCGHEFHSDCLVKWYRGYISCPVCSEIYGIKTGFQPDGTMNVRKVKPNLCPLASFEEYGTYIINYSFPSGTQGEDHPAPGKRYSGTSRTCYLPDNEEGRELLELFRIAFDRRLIFRIGTSVTTGQKNTVIWNGIHMKTNTHGGTSSFGYPDPTYFERVKAELSDVGVTPSDIH